MDTSEKSTASQLMIMGFEALDYVRGCSADPGRLAAIFAKDSSFDDDRNEITIPPIHELFVGENHDENADEFVERLRRLGFRVHCSFDATHIGWRSTVLFPNARQAADLAADALAPLVDKCIRETRMEIEAAIAEYAFGTVIQKIMQYEEGVRTEVLIFLQNSGYVVTKYYESYGDFEDGGYEHRGYRVSWHPPKVVRDIDVPWWKFWRKK
jgi:hypothetical protein